MLLLDLRATERQAIRDAALPIQVLRSQILPSVLEGRAENVTARAFGSDEAGLKKWVMDQCTDSRELLAVSVGPLQLKKSLPNLRLNAELVRRGVRMVSLFDWASLPDEYVDHIILSATGMPYFLAYGPLPIKVLDRRTVMLEGPLTDEGRSMMLVARPEFVGAALHYIQVVRQHAVHAGQFVERIDDLTHRQHAVARLLAENHHDEAIAELLGLSVRTVRQEVATTLRTLGASTRFAAGARYARLTGPLG